MTTSNSIDFNLTRNELCIAALRTAGVVGLEQSVSAAYITHAAQKLNQLIKHWENSGIHIWTQKHATVFLVPEQVIYTLGSGGDRASETVVQTTTSVAASAAATTLTLTSVTGMTALDNIGIVLDSGVTFWTTIVSINTGTKVVTLNAGITTAATSGNVVFSYTTALGYRPLKITSACVRDTNLNDRMLGEPMGRQDYTDLPNKADVGTVFQYYYESLRDSAGKLYLYQAPTYGNETLQIEFRRSIQDFDTASDTPDLPSSWLLALEYNLALLLCPAYGKEGKKQALAADAARYLDEANRADFEALNINIVPRYR